MYKLTVLLFILATCAQHECGVWGRGGGGSGSGASNLRSSGGGVSSSMFVGKRNSFLAGAAAGNSITTEKPYDPKDLSQHGLSAWGLILVIIAAIVFAFSAYYGIICYPFLCKTEQNYQFMDVSSTITGATSRSIQSMDNFQIDPRDQKH